MKTVTSSALQTQQLAQKIAPKYRGGAIIALEGPLGAGKTVFAQGFAQGLGVTKRLLSPTFILIREYPLPGKKEGRLFHIDLYRLNNNLQIQELGLNEILANPQNITLIEWAEKLEPNAVKNITKVRITPISENKREIEIFQE